MNTTQIINELREHGFARLDREPYTSFELQRVPETTVDDGTVIPASWQLVARFEMGLAASASEWNPDETDRTNLDFGNAEFYVEQMVKACDERIVPEGFFLMRLSELSGDLVRHIRAALARGTTVVLKPPQDVPSQDVA